MKIAKYQLADGSVARFEVPDSTTLEEAQKIGDEYFRASSNFPRLPVFATPPERPGFFSSIGKGTESLASSTGTALGATFGSPEEAARAGLARSQGISERYGEGLGLEDLKKIYSEEGLFPAVKETLVAIPGAIGEQLPNIAATAAGARLGAMAGGAAGSVFPVVGTGIGAGAGAILGALAPSLIQQFGSNVERQGAEPGGDVSTGRALAAAVPQAGLDVAGAFIPLGRALTGKLLGKEVNTLLGVGDREAAEALSLESLKRVLTKGTAIGLAAEVPTEVTQQMLERLQAGLPLTSDDAFAEYGETAFRTALIAPVGAAGRLSERSAARSRIAREDEAARNESAQKAEQFAAYQQALQEAAAAQAQTNRAQQAAEAEPEYYNPRAEAQWADVKARKQQEAADLYNRGVAEEEAADFRAQRTDAEWNELEARRQREAQERAIQERRQQTITDQAQLPLTGGEAQLRLFSNETPTSEVVPEVSPAQQRLPFTDEQQGLNFNRPSVLPSNVRLLNISPPQTQAQGQMQLPLVGGEAQLRLFPNQEVAQETTPEVSSAQRRLPFSNEQPDLDFESTQPALVQNKTQIALETLKTKGGASIKEIAAATQTTGPEASKIVRQLKDQGSVEWNKKLQKWQLKKTPEPIIPVAPTVTKSKKKFTGLKPKAAAFEKAVEETTNEVQPGITGEPISESGRRGVNVPAPGVRTTEPRVAEARATGLARPDRRVAPVDEGKASSEPALKKYTPPPGRFELVRQAQEKRRAAQTIEEEPDTVSLEEAEAIPTRRSSDLAEDQVEDIGYDDDFKPLRFSQAARPTQKIARSRLSNIIKNVTKNWLNPPAFQIVNSTEELSEKLDRSIPSDTRGLYFDGTVYLVNDNIENDAVAEATLFHESLGHYGLRNQFQRRLGQVLLSIYNTNSKLKNLADQWLINNPDTYKEFSKRLQQALAVEEVLSEQSEQGQIKDSGIRAAFNRIVAAVRDVLRRIGLVHTYSDNDVRNILRQAHSEVITGQKKVVSKAVPRFSATQQQNNTVQQVGRVQDFINNLPPISNETVGAAVNALSKVGDDLRPLALSFWSNNDLIYGYKSQLPDLVNYDKAVNMQASDQARRTEKVSKALEGWRDTINKSPRLKQQLPEFYRVANETTRLQIDVKDQKKFGNDQIYKDFYKLDPALQKIYFDMLDYYNKRADEYLDLFQKYLSPTLAQKFAQEYQKRRLKIYLPLFREGDYWLRYEDPNNQNETVYQAFQSPRERAIAEKAAADAGAVNLQSFVRTEQRLSAGPPPSGMLGEIVSELRNNPNLSASLRDDVLDTIYEAYLDTLPAQSLRQRFRADPRQGYLGFEPDVFKVFANVATRMGRQLSLMEYTPQINASVQKITEQAAKIATMPVKNVLDEVTKRVNTVYNPPSYALSNKASYLSYIWYMAANPSSAIVNVSQIPVVVLPLLGGKYGYGKTTSAISSATKRYFKGGWDSNSKFLPDYTFGANATGELKQLYDAGVARNAIRRSTGYDLTEARKKTLSDYTGLKSRIDRAMGWMMQNSERFNREVTLIAAFDLARQAGKPVDQAIEEAIQTVTDAHGTALAATGPRAFTTNVGQVMFTFKKYSQAMISLQVKLFNEAFKGATPQERAIARKTLLGIYGMAFSVAGVQGMPLYGAASLLASLLMGDEDEPYDPDEMVLESIGDLGYKGPLNKLLNLDIASRTGFNNMLWRDDPRRLAELGPLLYTMQQLTGPFGSIVLSAERAKKNFEEGEYTRGIEAMTPAIIRNFTRAIRFGTEGMLTKDGIKIVDDPSAWNIVMQAGGFSPADLAEARQRGSVMLEANRKISLRKAALLNQMDAARTSGDSEGIQRTLESITRFNQKNPSYRITMDTLRRSYRTRRQNERYVVDGVYIPKKHIAELQERFGNY